MKSKSIYSYTEIFPKYAKITKNKMVNIILNKDNIDIEISLLLPNEPDKLFAQSILYIYMCVCGKSTAPP